MANQTGRSIDPFLLNYQPSDLRIASEFLTTWLPFLSENLCNSCSRALSERVASLTPELRDEGISSFSPPSTPMESNDQSDVSEQANRPQSSSPPPPPVPPYSGTRLSWADMAQEEDELDDDEEEEEEQHSKASSVDEIPSMSSSSGKISSSQPKPKLTRSQREYLRFMNIKRKKDFICLERFQGKIVNIVDGLELHTGIFSAVEQTRIVDFIQNLQDMGKKGELKSRTYSAPRKWMKGKGRVTIQFGCCYNYATDKDGRTPGILRDETVDPIPPLFKVIIRRLVHWHVIPPSSVPDSCIVNIYEEGDCIPPHIDNHDFVRPFCTVSFLSESNIVFGTSLKISSPGEFIGAISVSLPVGSVLVLNGNGADIAKHCVPAVRRRRISITFRRMDTVKRPFGFVPESDLQGLEPLPYENKDVTQQRPSHRLHYRRGHSNGRGLRDLSNRLEVHRS